jgi:hypothetical protein
VEEVGRCQHGQNRTISVKDARDVVDYTVAQADAVPIGATAVTGNA